MAPGPRKPQTRPEASEEAELASVYAATRAETARKLGRPSAAQAWEKVENETKKEPAA